MLRFGGLAEYRICRGIRLRARSDGRRSGVRASRAHELGREKGGDLATAEQWPLLVRDRLIDQPLELAGSILIARRHHLDHVDPNQFLRGINPEARSGQATPVVLAYRPVETTLGRIDVDCEVEPEPVPRRQDG